VIRKAFLLGAGLGTRLRPLTERLPKPLVPLFHRPLLGWALDACAAAGIERFAVNTHHLPEAWRDPASGLGVEGWRDAGWRGANGEPARRGDWRGRPLDLIHEPELLETGGGIRNLAEWIGDEPVLVHNGDIYSSLPLPRLIEAHQRGGDLVTLALRRVGPAPHIALEGDRVIDIRGQLGRGEGEHGFSGIYVFSPELLARIPAERKVSVIPAFLEVAREGRLGGVVLEEGEWFDLGDPDSYLAAHRELHLAEPIHPAARVDPQARVEGSAIGPEALVEAGASVLDSVVWPRARVAAGERLERAIRLPESADSGLAGDR